MKPGVAIYSSDPETVWNVFRLGVFSLKQGDAVSVFLLGKGVKVESLDTSQFKINEQMRSFVDAGGVITACGTCLKLHNSEGLEICPVSTMKDLYSLIRESDRVVTF